jgi:tRNA(Ile)-lysidine synthase
LSSKHAPLPLALKLESAYRKLEALNERLLLAVSGGADSTALLLASCEVAQTLGLEIAVASLDHGLRSESEAEVKRVERLAAERGLSSYTRALRIGEGPNLEARARRARYEALEEMRAEAQCDRIVTAHTATDQAETLLMRLIRGADLSGAAGIRSKVGRILRPMLGCTREEVEAYLADQRVSFVTDPMNLNPRFARARIRAGVLPALASAGSHAIEHLAAFAASAAEDAALLEQMAAIAYQRIQLAPGKLDAAGLRALLPPLRRRVLAQLMLEAGARVDRRALERAEAAVGSGARTDLSEGWELRCAGATVRCCLAEERGARPLATTISGLRVQLVRERPGDLQEMWVEVGEVRLPLSVRRRRPGDRLRARRGVGRTKLQNLLVDLGVPAEERDMVPIVCDADGEIVWVIGWWPKAGRGSKGPARPEKSRNYLVAEVASNLRAQK